VLVAGIAWTLVLLVLAAITAAKGKWGTLVLGLIVFPAWLVGALRLAKPHSLWARRFYDEEKRAKANARAADPGIARVALVTLGVVGAVLFIGFLALFKAYRIPSSAMEPTLHCARPLPGCTASTSDRIAAVRLWFGIEPARGDLVTFEAPDVALTRCGTSGIFVKRVIGLPGDRVELRTDAVFVNGSELLEPYLEPASRDSASTQLVTVPADTYFLLGDNRGSSCDSRDYGPVPRDALVAKLLFRYWPLSRIGTP
jgi:signal peptidase I